MNIRGKILLCLLLSALLPAICGLAADKDPADKNKAPRAPLIGIKTNALMDFAPYIPDYGWCPMPNVALEFYPDRNSKDRKWTLQASFDMPWWAEMNGRHKYFQARNYQLETRRYFKPEMTFSGWFLSAYAHACMYGVGLDSKRGWQGEGAGAGLGAGYVLPLSKSRSWKMEFSIQAGYFYTGYDQYVYKDPVTGEDTGLYYYNWTGSAEDFVPRQYRWSWVGPTRVGISLSYDLFKRKREGSR